MVVLNQLLHLLCRGLPSYLTEAKPWSQPEHQSLCNAMANLVEDRQMYADRVAKAILDRGGYPDPGQFPLEYTSLNEVSMEYLVHELIDSLRADMEILQGYSAQLAEIRPLHALVEEIIGNTKGHREILEKVIKG